MELLFTYKRRAITENCYGIRLKARRSVKKALLQRFPTYLFMIPQSLADRHNQGFSFNHIIKRELELPIPPVNSDDPYLVGQQQNDLTALSQEVEDTVREFMRESAVTRYSDTSLVVMRIDRADKPLFDR